MSSVGIHVEADCLPAAWEAAVLECWHRGSSIPTQYDKPGDPLSRDCSATIIVREPLAEPRLHRSFPGSLGDLWRYRGEVLDGINDHLIDTTSLTKWHYTYHFRLNIGLGIAQLSRCLDLLAECPYTRRAVASLWDVGEDLYSIEPPCVQYLWFRVYDEKLSMHLHIRSNDAFKAGFMNMFAFTELQARMAQQLSLRLKRPIGIGPYHHFADSWHIYGSYFEEFKRFLEVSSHRTLAERTWNSREPIVQECFAEAQAEIERRPC